MQRQAVAKVQRSPAHGAPKQPARPASIPHSLIQLQQSIGNLATERLINSPYIRTKLQVSTPRDPSELEGSRNFGSDKLQRAPDEETIWMWHSPAKSGLKNFLCAETNGTSAKNIMWSGGVNILPLM